jgi:hypothetical protein
MAFDFSDYDGLPEELTPERLAVFCRLNQLETWFRELVYVETKARFGSTWWQECAAALRRNKDRGIPPEKSLKRDAKHHHMATAENDPLWFISFDSLLKILFDRKLWKLFLPYLTTKQLVRAKFIELMPIRHRIAHCRALHPDDLARVEHVMKDFDQGFWTFCTSYNNSLTFNRKGTKRDPVFEHVEKGLAPPPSTRTEVAISMLVRPTARFPQGWSAAGQKGVLYDVRFIAHHPNRFKSADVLKYTSARHADIVHILLDSREEWIRVTIPAVLGAAKVIEIIDRFDYICRNTTTPFGHPIGPSEHDEFKKHVKQTQAAMRQVASQWPHYVIPPGNPLSFLDPDCPCSFFSV